MSRHGVDVLVITALKMEYDSARGCDDGKVNDWCLQRDAAGFPYEIRDYRASDEGYLRFAITHTTQMAGVDAATVATRLVGELAPRCLAMCGVCAGHRGDVALGDVIIADRVFQYDYGKLMANGLETEILRDIQTYNLDKRWLHAAQHFDARSLSCWVDPDRDAQERWVLERLFHGEAPQSHPARARACPDWTQVLASLWEGRYLRPKRIELTKKGRRRIEEYFLLYPEGPEHLPLNVHVGPIATGNHVVMDPSIWSHIGKFQRKVLGLEMEAAAVAHVAAAQGIERFLIVKGVMDHGDATKNNRYKTFAARAAAYTLFSFLRKQLSPAAGLARSEPRSPAREERSQRSTATPVRQTIERIRQESAELNQTVATDLRPFVSRKHQGSFVWLPDNIDDSDIDVQSTCTALMTLCVNRCLPDFFKEQNSWREVLRLVETMLAADWLQKEPLIGADESLDPQQVIKQVNKFIAVLFLRTAMLLRECYGFKEIILEKMDARMGQVCQYIAENMGHESLKIMDYPVHPAIAYWYADAIFHDPLEQTKQVWVELTRWGRERFLEQISFFSAKKYSLIDPIALAMTSCLLMKIHKKAWNIEALARLVNVMLPTKLELQNGISLFLRAQNEAGAWTKIFPMFHYTKFNMGAEYCWFLEVLEAILAEFEDILQEELFLEATDRVIKWCRSNRLRYLSENMIFSGWNSGTKLSAVAQGQPESWATGIVHIYLSRLQEASVRQLERL